MNPSLVPVDFYPMWVRLDIKGEEKSSRPKVNYNDARVKFIEASIDMAFQDMENQDFQYKFFFKKLTPTHFHSLNHESYDASLKLSKIGILVFVIPQHIIFRKSD